MALNPVLLFLGGLVVVVLGAELLLHQLGELVAQLHAERARRRIAAHQQPDEQHQHRGQQAGEQHLGGGQLQRAHP